VAERAGDLARLVERDELLVQRRGPAKLNIGAWPPATTMASKRATSISETGFVSATSAASSGCG
jgi:hypothetical protein